MKKTLLFGILLVVFALAAISASPAYGGNSNSEDGLERAK